MRRTTQGPKERAGLREPRRWELVGVFVGVGWEGCSTAGEVDASEFGDEEGEADADGGEEGALVLLGGEHEDGEDKLGGEEHFDDCYMLVWKAHPFALKHVHNPRAMEVCPLSVVLTAMGPGKSAATTPAAAMPASISAMKTRPARDQVIAPTSASPRVTAGLKSPVDIPNQHKSTHQPYV